jgi:GrpB-like predicted nucleotidyltransferase (UPF0157 family)
MATRPTGPRAVVVDPDPTWPLRAAALADQVRAALGPAAVRTEHIGSTSIPGMAAKDILDMQVSVADLADAVGAGVGGAVRLATVVATARTCSPGRAP